MPLSDSTVGRDECHLFPALTLVIGYYDADSIQFPCFPLCVLWPITILPCFTPFVLLFPSECCRSALFECANRFALRSRCCRPHGLTFSARRDGRCHDPVGLLYEAARPKRYLDSYCETIQERGPISTRSAKSEPFREKPSLPIRGLISIAERLDHLLCERFTKRLTREETTLQNGAEDRSDQLACILRAG
jgi:hypothetical protein